MKRKTHVPEEVLRRFHDSSAPPKEEGAPALVDCPACGGLGKTSARRAMGIAALLMLKADEVPR